MIAKRAVLGWFNTLCVVVLFLFRLYCSIAMLFLFCVLDVVLFMKIWGCLSFGLLLSFAFFDSSGAFMVPCCVISIASRAFMIDAFAFTCAMSFFAAFATC